MGAIIVVLLLMFAAYSGGYVQASRKAEKEIREAESKGWNRGFKARLRVKKETE